MPVTVEASLKPSRWRWIVPALLFAGFLILFIESHVPVVLWLSLGLIPWLFFHVWQADLTGDYLRLEAEEVIIWVQQESERYRWAGRGQRSFGFIRFDLDSDEGRAALVIWRDSVTEPSWRALNMAYRVNAANLINKTTPGSD